MPYEIMQPRFPVGMTYATPGALALEVDLSKYLRRHHCGDWGYELCAEDKAANEHSLKDGSRLLSRYSTPSGSIYIITEWDRSMTTLLLPEEY